MTNRPLHAVKCPCGHTFATTSPNGHYCENCRRLRMRIMLRHHNRVRSGSERRDQLPELIERDYQVAIGQAQAKAKSGTRKRAKTVPQTRCKFCGHTAKAGQEFCADCIHDGYDAVYALTGRSNGWDRRGQGAQNVQPGWRGQKVAGGRAFFRRAE